jgi:hypothetical protein
MLGFAILALVCIAAGLTQIISRVAGQKHAVGPRCRRCGYDLRGHVGSTTSAIRAKVNCSECGADLSLPTAVTRAKTQRSAKQVLLGVAIALFPWLLTAIYGLALFIGPHGEGLRSNQSIIDAFKADPVPTWECDVLGQRAVRNALSASDIQQVIGDWISRSEPGAERWEVSNFLFQPAVSRAISAAQYRALTQKFWGNSVPVIRLRQTTADCIDFVVNLDASKGSPSNPCLKYALGLADVSLCPDSDVSTSQPSGSWIGIDPSRSNFGPMGGTQFVGRVAVTAKPGEYKARFSFNVGMAFQNGWNPGFGGIGARSSATNGFSFSSVVLPIEVPPPPVKYNSLGATLVTDGRYDSVFDERVSVANAFAQIYSDSTVLVVNLRYHDLPIIYFFTPTITVDGISISGTRSFLAQGGSFEPQVQFMAPAFTPKQEFMHIDLAPDLNGVRQSGFGPCWGGSLSFSHVPFSVYRERGSYADLQKWMDDQAKKYAASHPWNNGQPSK